MFRLLAWRMDRPACADTAVLYSRHGEEALQGDVPQPRQGLRAVRAPGRVGRVVGVHRSRRPGLRRARRRAGRPHRGTPARRVRQHPRAAPADAEHRADRGSREERPVRDPRRAHRGNRGDAVPGAGKAASHRSAVGRRGARNRLFNAAARRVRRIARAPSPALAPDTPVPRRWPAAALASSGEPPLRRSLSACSTTSGCGARLDRLALGV